MKDIGNVLSIVVVLAIIYLLVKPSSYGPALIKATTQSFATLINYATTG